MANATWSDDVPAASDSCLEDLLAMLDDLQTDGDSAPTGVVYEPATVIMIGIGAVSIFANLLSLLAVTQINKTRLTTYLRLLISLAVSDILVGCCVLLSAVKMNPLDSPLELCLFISWRGLRMTSHLISLLNLFGLGLDHYLAIVRPVRHRGSSFPASWMIAGFWVVSVTCGFSDFLLPSAPYLHCSESPVADGNTTADCGDLAEFWDAFGLGDNATYESERPSNDSVLRHAIRRRRGAASANDSRRHVTTGASLDYCESVMCSKYDSEYLVFLLAVILVLVMVVLYSKVCYKIYHCDGFLGRANGQRSLHRNKRGLITTLCIVGVFMVCWLPYCVFTIVTILRMVTDLSSAHESYSLAVKLDIYLYHLLLLNSLCDPVIYAARIREVRLGYRRLFGLCCFSKDNDNAWTRQQSHLSRDYHSESYRLTHAQSRNGGGPRGPGCETEEVK